MEDLVAKAPRGSELGKFLRTSVFRIQTYGQWELMVRQWGNAMERKADRPARGASRAARADDGGAEEENGEWDGGEGDEEPAGRTGDARQVGGLRRPNAQRGGPKPGPDAVSRVPKCEECGESPLWAMPQCDREAGPELRTPTRGLVLCAHRLAGRRCVPEVDDVRAKFVRTVCGGQP